MQRMSGKTTDDPVSSSMALELHDGPTGVYVTAALNVVYSAPVGTTLESLARSQQAKERFMQELADALLTEARSAWDAVLGRG